MTAADKYARYEIAEQALAAVEGVLEDWSGSDWLCTRPSQDIENLVRVANARIRMAASIRDRRNARWLARVTSFSFPRPHEQGERLCFTVDITDGPKTAKGRKVEVQIPESDAVTLAEQILRMAGRKK